MKQRRIVDASINWVDVSKIEQTAIIIIKPKTSLLDRLMAVFDVHGKGWVVINTKTAASVSAHYEIGKLFETYRKEYDLFALTDE